jgi:hypothetical protein
MNLQDYLENTSIPRLQNGTCGFVYTFHPVAIEFFDAAIRDYINAFEAASGETAEKLAEGVGLLMLARIITGKMPC